jgi:hypothetical protein
VCFEQRQEQMIRIAPDGDGLTVIVANEFASADERFRDALYRAPTRLIFKAVGGHFLGFLPSAGERWVRLSELVDTGPTGARVSDCGYHAAGISEGLQEALSSLGVR